MRIVLDTNVLVAGLLSPSGPPAWILDAVLTGDIELAFDPAIRDEYEDVLRRPEFEFAPDDIGKFFAVIDRFGLLVTAPPPCLKPLPDPDDEPFLAVAAATGGTLVTGNLKHFPPKLRQDVIVQTPRQFIDSIR